MTPKYSKLFFCACTSVVLCLTGVGQQNRLIYDTSTIALINFSNIENWPIFNNYKVANLIQSDFALIDSLLNKAIYDYNNIKTTAFAGEKIDIKKYNYKKQLITATNAKGEKEVWVNCFCRTNDNRWKSDIIIVDDGGSCYFNLKINLTTRIAYGLTVNGEA